MEYGLCCLFFKEPIKFKTYTLTNIKKIFQVSSFDAKNKVFEVWENNIVMLQKAFDYCHQNNILSYRVSSDLFPHTTNIIELGVVSQSEFNFYLNKLSKLDSYNLKLSMHPGQHVNMGSPSQDVITNSVKDLREHFVVAESLNCSEINIHIGGSYGDKDTTKVRFVQNMKTLLTPKELKLITIENDELNFNINDCIEVASQLGIRVTYDIHHQRCNELKYESTGTVRENFEKARKTWAGYGYQRLHISSPRDGFVSITKARPHSDYINPVDFPKFLLEYPDVHVDIEAKNKEDAIFTLRDFLKK